MQTFKSFNNNCRTSRSRPCVRCVWTGWKTWSSCVATALASCVATAWASVPSAASPSSAASSSTEAQHIQILPQVLLHQRYHTLLHPQLRRTRIIAPVLPSPMDFCYKNDGVTYRLFSQWLQICHFHVSLGPEVLTVVDYRLGNVKYRQWKAGLNGIFKSENCIGVRCNDSMAGAVTCCTCLKDCQVETLWLCAVYQRHYDHQLSHVAP